MSADSKAAATENHIFIREASEADLEVMIDIQKNDGYEHHYYLTMERLVNLFIRGEMFYMAYWGDEPAGFASVDFEQRARLHFLCVKVEYTRRGIGGSLMRRMLNEARGRDYASAHTFVEANSPKEIFLTKMGFYEVGVYRDRYGKGNDASIWQYLIKE